MKAKIYLLYVLLLLCAMEIVSASLFTNNFRAKNRSAIAIQSINGASRRLYTGGRLDLVHLSLVGAYSDNIGTSTKIPQVKYEQSNPVIPPEAQYQLRSESSRALCLSFEEYPSDPGNNIRIV